MSDVPVRIRKATPADVAALHELIAASVRELQAEDYTHEQLEGALASVIGVDSQLIEDGTYLVAEVRVVETREEPGENADEANVEGKCSMAGCGGWSKRKTLFGGDRWTGREDALLDPKRDAAKIRAFFVHPRWARRGVGSKLLEACEAAARAAGFVRYEMGATLTGAKLFGARGYVAVERVEVSLKNGLTMPIIRMAKEARCENRVAGSP
ncbi:MAG TPA: GNAT family N-acetyltransferase [Candidatus Acidoferrum sp.]|nr:GNAT family N-acetyltransferase [Candidatus Acidoferrum sp.]